MKSVLEIFGSENYKGTIGVENDEIVLRYEYNFNENKYLLKVYIADNLRFVSYISVRLKKLLEILLEILILLEQLNGYYVVK